MYHNTLPIQLTSLIGREQEAASLRQLLRQPNVRLITITGPGGVGKTSLALHTAREAQAFFADGTYFISLAAINDPTLIIPTIAQTLGLPESPRQLWLESLKEYLSDRHVLLLLDNFEQIISAAPLLTELLSACARLRLLVTSREVLRVRGEQEFLLSPLALPDSPTTETLLQYPSIALFVQRAQATQFEFRLTPENAAAVAEVCTRLDGLPLALELAAARIKLFPPHAMLARLREAPLQLLTVGARDLPARQQTLRREIQWGYDLLDDEERRCFRWFSVFVGGSTLEAALAVLGPPTSLEIFDSLASKSLLRQIETDAAVRLLMLETIREFGLEQLVVLGEIGAARRAHADVYLAFAEAAERTLTGADQKVWLERLDREQNNLRAALHWAIERHQAEFAQRLAGALRPYWFARGHWSEGRRWLEEALALGTDDAVDQTVRAKTLYGAGALARYQGDFARARSLCEQSLALYRTLEEHAGVVTALVQLARISTFQGDHSGTKAFLAEIASLIEGLPDTVLKGDAYASVVLARVESGATQSPAEASRYLAESERIHRTLNNPAGVAFAILHQAVRALRESDDSLAASRFNEAERLAVELGDDRLVSRIALARVPLDVRAGDFAIARHRLEETIQRTNKRGDHHLRSALVMLATILHRQGLATWSARVFGLTSARAGPGQMAIEDAAMRWLETGEAFAEVRALLGDEAFAREIAIGGRLTLDDLPAIPQPTPATVPPSSSTFGASVTAREVEVLRLLAQDLSNPQIAERLVVSRRTVDAHLRSIYDKLGVRSRDAAIRAGEVLGLLGR